jgi:hypothetical protein
MTRCAILAAIPAAIAGLVLAGCGTTGEPTVKTVSVDVPTPVACVPADTPSGPGPSLSAARLLAARDAAARYQLLAEFWTAASPDLTMLAGVIEACRTAAPPPVQ